MTPQEKLALRLAMTPAAYQKWLELGFTEGDAATLVEVHGHPKLAAADMLGALVNLARANGGKVKVGQLEVTMPTELYAARAAELRAEVGAAAVSPGPVFTELS